MRNKVKVKSGVTEFEVIGSDDVVKQESENCLKMLFPAPGSEIGMTLVDVKNGQAVRTERGRWNMGRPCNEDAVGKRYIKNDNLMLYRDSNREILEGSGLRCDKSDQERENTERSMVRKVFFCILHSLLRH